MKYPLSITVRQMDGVVVFVLITAVICLLSSLPFQPVSQDDAIVNGDPRDGPIVVKLGNVQQGGVYYLPEGATLSRLLDIAGVKPQDRGGAEMLNTPLAAGQTILLSAGYPPKIGWMDARERLALDLPIDLNRAEIEDLMLIPGIGEKTAARIIRFRETSGPFRKVKDLLNIPGIKEKKLAKWGRYFYLP